MAAAEAKPDAFRSEDLFAGFTLRASPATLALMRPLIESKRDKHWAVSWVGVRWAEASVYLPWRKPAAFRAAYAWFRRNLPGLTEWTLDGHAPGAKTLASADAVMSILPHVRQQGYGEDNEEQEDGLLCLAVPVFDRFDRVIVAVVPDDAVRTRRRITSRC